MALSVCWGGVFDRSLANMKNEGLIVYADWYTTSIS